MVIYFLNMGKMKSNQLLNEVYLLKVQEQRDYNMLFNMISGLPLYVANYIKYKLNENVSPSTLLEYVRDFNRFFEWITLHKDTVYSFSDITIELLQQLNVDDIYKFIDDLMAERNLVERSISRKVHSLRSLFNYLHDIAENDDGTPLLMYNVFRKIKMKRVSDVQSTARSIQSNVLQANEIQDFICFVREGFRLKLADNLQAIWNYDLNVHRDTCIVSLLLNSGLLVSDIVNLNVKDISLHRHQVSIVRQRSKSRTSHIVHFTSSAQTDLERYLSIREEIYKPQNDEPALFLSLPNGKTYGSRMTKRGIQAMVIKYRVHFGMPNLTTRQLAHSFGIEHIRNSNIVQTKHQLAQRSIEATEKYQYLSEKSSDKY